MNQNHVGDRGGNICLSKAGINGSIVTAGTLNIANNVNYTIDGILYTLTAVNNQAFSSGHSTLAAGCECIFGVWVDSSQVVSTTQGAVVDTASLSAGTGNKVVAMPDLVASKALIGLVKVKTAGAATFVPGTTNCNATNVTCTFYDVHRAPTAPLLS